jgi:hypothetical protein
MRLPTGTSQVARLATVCAVAAIAVAGCGATTSGTVAASAASITAPAASAPATAPASAPASAPAAAGGTVPASCSAIPASIITPYVGPIATTHQISATGHSVSCEFESTPTSILIVNIGSGGTPASFSALEAGIGTGGRTTAAVPGLGSQAFSITNKGAPAGMSALTSSGVLISVTTRDSFAQDQSLIKALIALY